MTRLSISVPALAARRASQPEFSRRCIPTCGVTARSRVATALRPRQIMPVRCLAALGVTTDIHYRLLAIAFLIPFVIGSIAGAQLDVTGVWEITLNTQTGETTWTATFEQEGEKLLGKVDLGGREILPLEGTVEGSTIKLQFIVPDLDGDMPIDLAGEVDGATIAGDQGSFIWYGAGDWTGKKK